MSIRTLIEFNHDYFSELENNPDQVIEDLKQALRNPYDPDRLPHTNAFRVKYSRHHSEPCPVDKS